MKKGLLTTLLAAAASVSGIQAVYAAAPTISPLPDIIIGDAEDNNGGLTDNNYFVYTNAFNLDSRASDDATPVGQLLWSFGEGDPPAGSTGANLTSNWFTVNGKPPIGNNSAATAAALAAGAQHQQANNIRSVSQFATFRDVILSPGNGPLTTSFNPSQADKNLHAQGKVVTFFVSDGQGFTSDTIIVKSVDGANDSKSPAFEVNKRIDNQFATSAAGGKGERSENWTYFFPQDAQSNSAQRSVSYHAATTSLRAFVNTGTTAANASNSQKFRIVGWKEIEASEIAQPGFGGTSTELKYADVGATNWLRAKFHLFAQNASGGAAISNTNTIPNFRLRISGANFSFASLLEIEHHVSSGNATLVNGTRLDTALRDFAPTNDPANPRVYRVDMDPPELAAYTASPTTLGYVRAFEAYARDIEPQENGFLCLGESSMNTYLAPTTGFTTLKTYGSAEMNSGVGPNAGQVNQTLAIVYDYATGNIDSAALNGQQFGTTPLTPTNQVSFTGSPTGFTIDTSQIETNNGNVAKLVVATADWVNGTTADSNFANRARVEPDTQYRVKFKLSANVAANVNAMIRLRSSSLGFNYNPRLEVGGSQGSNFNYTHQYLPGTGGFTGTHDLIYLTPFTINPASQGGGARIGSEAGPGVNQTSYRDIQLGFDILDEFVNPTTAKGNAKLENAVIEKFPLIQD